MHVHFLHLVERKEKNNSHSIQNVNDGQTVLVHETNAELVSWPQLKKQQTKKIRAHVHW